MNLLRRATKLRFRRTTLLIVASSSFVLGVLCAPLAGLSFSWLILALPLIIVLRKKQIAALLLCVVLGIVLGQLRGLSELRQQAPLTSLINQKVELQAKVVEDGTYDSRKRTTFVAYTTQIISPRTEKVSGPIRVSTFTAPNVKAGDIIRVKGKLTTTRGLNLANMNFAEVEVIGRQTTRFYEFRRNFEAGLRNAIPEPQASFAAGLLIGQRSGLSDQWQDILRDSGLTHIVAVSGYNLTILVLFVRRLLRKTSRFQMLLASLALVFAFVAVTGLSPSILRATCVVLILQLCWYFGKQVRPLVVIALAAAITAMIDPSQVWRSVGWYLSFAAFFGILVLAPLANKEMRPTVSVDLEKNPHPFRSLVTESIAALVMTAPIIVLIFGRFSLVALPTNILVAPLVPLAMLTSFIAGLAGMLVPIVSGLVGLPATAVLTLILDIANIAARLPGAVVEVSLQWYWLLIFYGVLCGAAFFAYRIRSNRNALRS